MPKILSPNQLIDHMIHNMKYGLHDNDMNFINGDSVNINDSETGYIILTNPKDMESRECYYKYSDVLYQHHYFEKFLKKGLISEYQFLYMKLNDVDDFAVIIYYIKKNMEWICFSPLMNKLYKVKIEDGFTSDDVKNKLISMLIHKFGKNQYSKVTYELYDSDKFDEFWKAIKSEHKKVKFIE